MAVGGAVETLTESEKSLTRREKKAQVIAAGLGSC